VEVLHEDLDAVGAGGVEDGAELGAGVVGVPGLAAEDGGVVLRQAQATLL